MYETKFGLECPLGILQADVTPPARVRMVLGTNAVLFPSAGLAHLIFSLGKLKIPQASNPSFP